MREFLKAIGFAVAVLVVLWLAMWLDYQSMAWQTEGLKPDAWRAVQRNASGYYRYRDAFGDDWTTTRWKAERAEERERLGE